MQTQAEIFLQVVQMIGPEGYYARTGKEKAIMTGLEKNRLVKKKPGTKRVYIVNSEGIAEQGQTKDSFKQQLKKYFLELRTLQQPFVSITELRDLFSTLGLEKELFNHYLIELYDNNEVELEKSFTVKDGELTGLNYKNKKYFSYILSID